MQLTPEQIHQYQTEGFLVLPNLMPPEHLEILRQGAQHSVDVVDRAMDQQGVDRIGLNLKGVRYFYEPGP